MSEFGPIRNSGSMGASSVFSIGEVTKCSRDYVHKARATLLPEIEATIDSDALLRSARQRLSDLPAPQKIVLDSGVVQSYRVYSSSSEPPVHDLTTEEIDESASASAASGSPIPSSSGSGGGQRPGEEARARKILLLHGAGQNGACFHLVAKGLATSGYDVVVPDLRGHGLTSSPPPSAKLYESNLGYHPALIAEDMAEMSTSDSHQLAGPHEPYHAVLGDGLGATVAVYLASNFPTLVRSLFLLDFHPFESSPWDTSFYPGQAGVFHSAREAIAFIKMPSMQGVNRTIEGAALQAAATMRELGGRPDSTGGPGPGEPSGAEGIKHNQVFDSPVRLGTSSSSRGLGSVVFRMDPQFLARFDADDIRSRLSKLQCHVRFLSAMHSGLLSANIARKAARFCRTAASSGFVQIACSHSAATDAPEVLVHHLSNLFGAKELERDPYEKALPSRSSSGVPGSEHKVKVPFFSFGTEAVQPWGTELGDQDLARTFGEQLSIK